MGLNIYNPIPARILEIVKHTSQEWSFFRLEYPAASETGQVYFCVHCR